MNIDEIKEQFDSGAKDYDSQRRGLIPDFDNFYTRAVSLLKFYKRDFRNIIDLGAGSGLLTQELYKLFPRACYTLVDVSQKMMALARERFVGLPNFRYIDADYVLRFPPPLEDKAPCDLIASAVSIHHLETEQKEELYKNIFKFLPPGGVFMDCDQFHASSPAINGLYTAWWDDFMDKSSFTTAEQRAASRGRRKLDREESIHDTLAMLREAGFGSVDCIYHFMKFGVVLAIK
jgi:tRNA (cmo5U34)-methyltransferase